MSFRGMLAGIILLTCIVDCCKAAGMDYVGIGYNLLTANPDGGMASRGGVDPGLLVTRTVLDLASHPEAIETHTRHSCSHERSTRTFYGTKSYQDKLNVGVKLEGGGFAGLVKAAFTLSPRFKKEENRTSIDHKVFQDQEDVCNLGHARFKDELADFLKVTVTDSFASAVCQLPASYSQREYMAFLDHWGTHMTTEVDLGTKVINRSETSLAEYVQHVAKASGADVSLSGTYMGFGASLGVNFDSFKSRDAYRKSFGSHSLLLEVGSNAMPEPIRVTLVSIDKALQSKYWNHGLLKLVSENICPESWTPEAAASNLKQALGEYATFKMVLEPRDPPLVVPLTWPRGTYGLMKPRSGCPGGRMTWQEGWRYQDAGSHFMSSNEVGHLTHLAGDWEGDENIRMDFCIKGRQTFSQFDVEWPKGDYCVLKYGPCPSGFLSGFVQWNDADMGNDDQKGGTLPDGVYDENTQIQYCCRSDDLPTNPIFLPVEKPFYLLRHKRGCQQVQGMHVHEETVKWDEAFSMFGFHKPRLGGEHPYDDGDGSHHRLHFCYYLPQRSGNVDPIVG